MHIFINYVDLIEFERGICVSSRELRLTLTLITLVSHQSPHTYTMIERIHSFYNIFSWVSFKLHQRFQNSRLHIHCILLFHVVVLSRNHMYIIMRTQTAERTQILGFIFLLKCWMMNISVGSILLLSGLWDAFRWLLPASSARGGRNGEHRGNLGDPPILWVLQWPLPPLPTHT